MTPSTRKPNVQLNPRWVTIHQTRISRPTVIPPPTLKRSNICENGHDTKTTCQKLHPKSEEPALIAMDARTAKLPEYRMPKPMPDQMSRTFHQGQESFCMSALPQELRDAAERPD